MKKIFTWLFADLLLQLYNYAEQKFTLSIVSTAQFAVFINGIEQPATRFESFLPSGMQESVSNQVNGSVMIPINPGDAVEIRSVAGLTNLANFTLGGVVASVTVQRVNI